jgi:diguanylate cyclase (GGDEF)-like protein
MINPAYMTRQISEIAKEKDGVQFHITSLNPLRPENKPTEIETEFLKAFEAGETEKGMFIQEGTKTSYFYMAPLVTEKACLQCHAKQGYVESDVRGGISITSPVNMDISHFSLAWSHLILGLLGILGIIFATYSLQKAYKLLEKQAAYDALTDIPNRRSFEERLEREYKLSRRENKPLSIIMCDIDKFKAYNDTYGHNSGDQCLRKVAQSIQSSLKRPADFCARYGGEEFIVLLANTDAEGARHIAERIQLDIEKMAIPHLKGFPLPIVTLSLGIATLEKTSTATEEMLIKDADTALYYSKEHGRNQVTHFDSMNDDLM